MQKFQQIFGDKKVVIGMIHLQALPATPKNEYPVEQIKEMALQEAAIYKAAGVDAIMLENMHDVPYLKNEVGPEIIAAMSIIAKVVKEATQLPCGIQVLAAANKAALAIALAAGLDFIRAEGFVFGHLADEGYIDSNAGELLRYRKAIGAEHIAVFTDIKKKHSAHAPTADVSLLETAKAAEFFLTDGLIITGKSTGETASIQELQTLKGQVKSPIFIGSGVNLENIEQYHPLADAFIVGSHFKKEGYWENELDKERIELFMNKLKSKL